ncbi:MAG: glutamate--tRNA ligase family protein, partial [Proteobacteria bacterium]|nr:glutamate--tRNA ligase family protein [Pseudomonadota bacterium]
MSNPAPKPTPSQSNFIRQRIEADLASGKVKAVKTRFPPEPNGYLHLGHAKSILLNFGLAREYGGACNLRFDDTNPEKEEQEYVDSIIESVKWLVPEFDGKALFASDYFDFMYRCAEYLVSSGNAYVDSQSADEMKRRRGDFTHPGTDSPFRSRSAEENLMLLREMRDGKHADGAHVLRAKISMTSPNINMRDPALYRIKRATHHRTGDKWCIYPMYTYAHPIEDAVEGITHSLCTLEFEDQRPFYDWLLGKLADGGLLQQPLPQQIEFARLQLTYVLLSKRLLIKLVEDKVVYGI